MAAIKSYRELEIWQLSMELAEDIYKVLKTFPREELYGLSDQIRRAAVSVPSNIAEGFGRDSNNDFAHFVSIAKGSLFEVSTQLELASRLGYLPSGTKFSPRLTTIGKKLTAFRNHLLAHPRPPHHHQPPTINH